MSTLRADAHRNVVSRTSPKESESREKDLISVTSVTPAAGAPDLRTSRTILPRIIDYYLALLPGVIPSPARQWLFLAFTDGRFGASPQCEVVRAATTEGAHSLTNQLS